MLFVITVCNTVSLSIDIKIFFYQFDPSLFDNPAPETLWEKMSELELPSNFPVPQPWFEAKLVTKSTEASNAWLLQFLCQRLKLQCFITATNTLPPIYWLFCIHIEVNIHTAFMQKTFIHHINKYLGRGLYFGPKIIFIPPLSENDSFPLLVTLRFRKWMLIQNANWMKSRSKYWSLVHPVSVPIYLSIAI